MKKLLFFLIVYLLMVSCNGDDNNLSEAVTQTINAEILEGFTRATMDEDVAINWSDGDKVSAFIGTSLNEEFSIATGVGTRSAVFKIKKNNQKQSENTNLSYNVAYYPHEDNVNITEISSTSALLNIILPKVQTYAYNSLRNGTIPMGAISENNDFQFKNILGIARFKLTGSGIIKKVEFKGNNSEIICGEASVVISKNGSPAISVTGIDKTITLDCGEGVKLSDTIVNFDIALPPMTFEKGFTVRFYESDYNYMEKTVEKPFSIERSVLKTITEYEYESPDIRILSNFIVPRGVNGNSYSRVRMPSIAVFKDMICVFVIAYDETDFNSNDYASSGGYVLTYDKNFNFISSFELPIQTIGYKYGTANGGVFFKSNNTQTLYLALSRQFKENKVSEETVNSGIRIYSTNDGLTWNIAHDYTESDFTFPEMRKHIVTGGSKGIIDRKGRYIIPLYCFSPMVAGFMSINPDDFNEFDTFWDVEMADKEPNESCVFLNNDGNIVLSSRGVETGSAKGAPRWVRVFQDQVFENYYGNGIGPVPACQETWMHPFNNIIIRSRNDDPMYRRNYSLWVSEDEGLSFKRLVKLNAGGGYGDFDIEGNLLYVTYETDAFSESNAVWAAKVYSKKSYTDKH